MPISCRNRHCPKCQSLARAEWLEDRRAEILDTQYFHVVRTGRLASRHPTRCSPGWWTRPRTPSRHEMRKVFAAKLESTHLPRTRLRTGQEPPPAQWVEL